jgi:hypothetical protein
MPPRSDSDSAPLHLRSPPCSFSLFFLAQPQKTTDNDERQKHQARARAYVLVAPASGPRLLCLAL